MVEKLSKHALYPLADRLAPYSAWDQSLRAQWTGEKRPPKRGEWYLSGAFIEAYHAPNDLSTAFHIARIVRIKKIETIVEVLA